MKAEFLTSIIFLICPALAFADGPSRRALSDVNYSTFKSSEGIGGLNGFFNKQLSTGVVRLEYVFVSSPGVNSQLMLYDSDILNAGVGNATRTITSRDNTNAYGEIPFKIETSTKGLVYSSTCTACAGAWNPPLLRFGYERIR